MDYETTRKIALQNAINEIKVVAKSYCKYSNKMIVFITCEDMGETYNVVISDYNGDYVMQSQPFEELKDCLKIYNHYAEKEYEQS